jgi:hypothetical protein
MILMDPCGLIGNWDGSNEFYQEAYFNGEHAWPGQWVVRLEAEEDYTRVVASINGIYTAF